MRRKSKDGKHMKKKVIENIKMEEEERKTKRCRGGRMEEERRQKKEVGKGIKEHYFKLMTGERLNSWSEEP